MKTQMFKSISVKIAFNLPVCMFSTIFHSACACSREFTLFAMASISGLFPDPPRPRGFIWLAAITAESWLDNAELWLVSLELLETSLEVPDEAL